jgi:hypothetical protein
MTVRQLQLGSACLPSLIDSNELWTSLT